MLDDAAVRPVPAPPLRATIFIVPRYQPCSTLSCTCADNKPISACPPFHWCFRLQFVMLLKSVLDARKRLMVTFNIPKDTLEHLLERLPS